MYAIIWEYQVRVERVAEFEEIYSATGAWAKLFQRSKGYLGTELLTDTNHTDRYLTVDRWSSLQEYVSFLGEWKTEYENLDEQCEDLMEQEALVGHWESISPETR